MIELDMFLEDSIKERIYFLNRYRHAHGRENTICKECYDAWPQRTKQHTCAIIQSNFYTEGVSNV